MKGLVNKAFGYLATTAEDAFWESLGLASRNYGYEPEMPEQVKNYKASHTSKLEKLFDKISK